MTNRLELNWKVYGFIDEQRYYCSETLIDIENLPVPKAVLAADVRTYVDTDVEVRKTYYVCVGSVKNGIEKISSQAIADTRARFVHLIVNDGVMSDIGFLGKTWTNTSVSLANDVLSFSGASYLETTGFDFTVDFEVSAFIKIPSSGTSLAFNILTNTSKISEWTGERFEVFSFAVGGNANPKNTNRLYFDSPNPALYMRASTILSRDIEYKVGFRKIGTKLQLLVNDVVESEVSYISMTFKNYLNIGAFKEDIDQRFVGTIRNFEIIQP